VTAPVNASKPFSFFNSEFLAADGDSEQLRGVAPRLRLLHWAVTPDRSVEPVVQ
jgi:hypothetical protein